ncbi:enoyl-CoA hydratase/isomerase family protein [Actinoallomurus sp. CA-150999]|uniref:enoyl-CoA hydratase/isomerase family protein n=1 Tax=Actinoallomurus sp. CA-150999 TaxID=3239887 RepID=UPI003D8FFEA1
MYELDAWHDRMGGFADRPAFTEYADRYSDHFVVERHDGVVEVRMHTRGGPAVMSLGLHNAWGRLLRDVGSDPSNEVVILTGTGDAWMAGLDAASFGRPYRTWPADARYETYYDGIKLLENLVFSIDVPTIGAINGPGYHHELALLCDLTLCSDNTVFRDTHFRSGAVPGDGQHLAFQELIGLKQTALTLYTGEPIAAERACELGLVNQVLPLERLLPRAREYAGMLMDQPRTSRRMTHAVLQRPWKRRLVQDLAFGRSHQLFDA